MEEVWSTVHNTWVLAHCRLKTIETERSAEPVIYREENYSLIDPINLHNKVPNLIDWADIKGKWKFKSRL